MLPFFGSLFEPQRAGLFPFPLAVYPIVECGAKAASGIIGRDGLQELVQIEVFGCNLNIISTFVLPGSSVVY